MALVLYNSPFHEKQPFKPLEPDHVGLYVCGPTVYDLPHIGNARPVVVFDLLYRLLKRIYPRVTYVRNITDVDDKINKAALDRGISIAEVTEPVTNAFHQDIAALHALPPDLEPKATDHIAEMIRMIETLIASGHAYADQGHVLFAVPSMPDYGKFSNRNRDELIAGARVEVAPYKKDPADFVLWKPSNDQQPGWNSPWGYGRPGWHIECSAMAAKHLGVNFDIHGGGFDLIFPHHQNEVAQSLCAHPGSTFAQFWVHNGFVTVNGEKMSKSLGNFRTIRELLAQSPGEAVRLTLLSTHYRQPLDWTDQAVQAAKAGLDRFYRALDQAGPDLPTPEIPQSFIDALEDDLNTPQAIAELHVLAGKVFENADKTAAAQLKAAGQFIGLLMQEPKLWFQGDLSSGLSPEAIEAEIEARKQARLAKNYAEGDRIRKALLDQGVILEDGPKGTTWRRVS